MGISIDQFRSRIGSHEDLRPDLSENYDLSDDLNIPSTLLNNEPLILNELPDFDFRQMVQTPDKEQKEFFLSHFTSD